MEELQELVKEWTRKAQSPGNTDDERLVYYQCAKDLHEKIQLIRSLTC